MIESRILSRTPMWAVTPVAVVLSIILVVEWCVLIALKIASDGVIWALHRVVGER